MVKYCCVVACKTVWFPDSNISFHSFPFKNKELLNKWVKSVPSKGKISKYTFICNKHFLESDYEDRILRRRLKKTAVPSQFNIGSEKQVNMNLQINDKISVETKETELVLNEDPCNIEINERKCSPPSVKEDQLRRKIKILQNKLRRREFKVKNLQTMVKVLTRKRNRSKQRTS